MRSVILPRDVPGTFADTLLGLILTAGFECMPIHPKGDSGGQNAVQTYIHSKL